MKYLSIFFIGISGIIFLSAMSSCNACKNDDPKIRIVNNSSKTINAKLDWPSNSVTINSIAPGTSTPYREINGGVISITIQIDTVEQVNTIPTQSCREYIATLDADKKLQISMIQR